METFLSLTADSVFELMRPHSLGTLIEWKLPSFFSNTTKQVRNRPHSLGTLIEWKPIIEIMNFAMFDLSPLAGDIN